MRRAERAGSEAGEVDVGGNIDEELAVIVCWYRGGCGLEL